MIEVKNLTKNYGDKRAVDNISFTANDGEILGLSLIHISATCEVVFELMEMLGVPLTEDITKCIYTGIATDTGCFKYENTTATVSYTHLDVYKRQEKGRFQGCGADAGIFRLRSGYKLS